MRWGLDAGISRKVRCGIFGRSRTVRLWRVMEKFLGKCFGKKLMESIIAELKFFANGISLKVKEALR